MKPIFNILASWIVILLITCCESENTNNNNPAPLVLVGYLYQDEVIDSIYLTKALSYESEDTVFQSVTDAEVSITYNEREYSLDNIGNGYYSYGGSDLPVEVGNSYAISILSEGIETTAETVVPEIPTGVALSDTILYVDTTFTFGPSSNSEENGLEVTWDNPENSYFYILIENTDTSAAEIIMGTGDFPGGFEPPSGFFSFRSSPFQDDNYTINSMSLEKYGRHKVKIFRVNQEYVDLYENREQDSRNLTEPITNVQNGLGIFTAFSYAEAYFYVENEY